MNDNPKPKVIYLAHVSMGGPNLAKVEILSHAAKSMKCGPTTHLLGLVYAPNRIKYEGGDRYFTNANDALVYLKDELRRRLERLRTEAKRTANYLLDIQDVMLLDDVVESLTQKFREELATKMGTTLDEREAEKIEKGKPAK